MREMPAPCNGTCQRRVASTRHGCVTRHMQHLCNAARPEGAAKKWKRHPTRGKPPHCRPAAAMRTEVD
eukprot:73478-Alexandrium_andersonii.AAC.1